MWSRVVTKNAYGILKGRRCILYKRTECHLFYLGYVIMDCIALHNLCIELADPCQPIWKFEVQKLTLIWKQLHRKEDMKESALNRMKHPIGYGWIINESKEYPVTERF